MQTTNDATATDAMQCASTLQTLILTRERHHEMTRLRVVGLAHANVLGPSWNAAEQAAEPAYDKIDLHTGPGGRAKRLCDLDVVELILKTAVSRFRLHDCREGDGREAARPRRGGV